MRKVKKVVSVGKRVESECGESKVGRVRRGER